MKIAVLIDNWFDSFGGGPVHVLEISKRIKSSDCDIEIITCGSKTSVLTDRPKVTFLCQSRFLFPFLSFFYVLPRRFDLLHAHAYLPGVTGKFLSRLKNIPIILTIHGTALGKWQIIQPFFLARIFEKIEKWILFGISYDALISVSQDVLSIPHRSRTIVYIPNSSDHLPPKSGKFTTNSNFLFLGRFHPQKGLLFLIKAIDQIRKEIPGAVFFLAGSGGQKKAIVDLVQKLNLENIIKVLPAIKNSDLPKIYSQITFFILPSIYEGFPIAILEAMKNKKIVIASRVGELKFLLSNLKNGFLVDPADSTDLARAIKKALQFPNLEKIAEQASRTVSQFSWQKSAEMTYKLYVKTALD